ncbi:hypothetical protein BOTNAR_2273g00020 [Botryotinia narcissicola]|uniref:Uncharacterized protein n=1 Tax=Botryotinia narcissicola TaxID=278944 RepID=A0A4Z1HEL8_9HELO|nr:hypothetical protein BOTNAR_2273g00020 [Botryotinia narcissicola]
MFPIQPRRGRQRNKKLRPICIRARIRHRQDPRPDRGSAAAGARGIARLQHEVGDDAVEDDVVVVAAPDESLEVGARFGRVRRVEFEGYGALGEGEVRWI